MTTRRKGVPLAEMLARLPPERRAGIEVRTTELIAEEMTLRALRKAMGQTQVAMAERLGIKQENVSRIEQRSDMLLSTLDGYLRKLGGQLHLVAEFRGRPPVKLTGLAGMHGEDAGPVKRPGAAPARKRAGPKGPKEPVAKA